MEKETGLAIEEQKGIENNFSVVQVEIDGIKNAYNAILVKELNEATSKEAYDMYKTLKKMSGKLTKIHKTQKDFFLKGGQFVDSIKRMKLAEIDIMKENVISIKDHFENIEKERIEKLQIERAEKLSLYVEDASLMDLGSLDADYFEYLLDMKKTQHENELAQLKEMERLQAARIEAERIEQERIKAENDRLKKEVEYAEIERKKLAKIEAAKLKAIQDKAEKEAEKVRLEQAKKDAIEKAKQDAAAKKQAEILAADKARIKALEEKAAKEKARLEAEIIAAQEKEIARLEAIETAKQAELSKGDEEKIEMLLNEIEALKTKYTFESDNNKQLMKDVNELFTRTKKYINENR